MKSEMVGFFLCYGGVSFVTQNWHIGGIWKKFLGGWEKLVWGSVKTSFCTGKKIEKTVSCSQTTGFVIKETNTFRIQIRKTWKKSGLKLQEKFRVVKKWKSGEMRRKIIHIVKK